MIATCIPSAGLAVGAFDSAQVAGPGRSSLAIFTPATVDPAMARLVARAGNGAARMVRFTPAGLADRADRSVTVAVRVDERAALAIGARAKVEPAGVAAPALRLAPTSYNLGAARGYQSFAKPSTPALSRELAEAGIPDLATFRPAPGIKETPSRFAGRIARDEVARPAAADARGADPLDQSLDVAGSYRLTRNLDVTAGVRVSPRPERLAPLADTAKQDSQAVYLGTQFRF